MSDGSRIEWTDATWNPVTGCEKVSRGCKHCYAEREWPRLSAPRQKPNIYTGRTFVEVKCHPEKLNQPLSWNKPRRVFVNSMSDLFHPEVPSDFIQAVFSVMAQSPRHTFQVLTKRPDRMRSLLTEWITCLTFPSNPRRAILPNVWLGVSVEDQSTADERIPLLLQTPAAVRWVSAEPLLGEIDLERFLLSSYDKAAHDYQMLGTECRSNKLNWIVAGGESGPKARPMHPEWIRSLRDQCEERGTPFLFKQWGEWLSSDSCSVRQAREHRCIAMPGERGDAAMIRVGKKSAGRLLDGVLHDAYPEVA